MKKKINRRKIVPHKDGNPARQTRSARNIKFPPTIEVEMINSNEKDEEKR